MHICKSCKSHSPAGARFCSWCGTVISGQESRAQSLTGLLPSQSLLNNGHYAQIKNYQLVQKVGQGGMGAVYMEVLSAVPPLGVLLRPVAALSTNLERSRLAEIKMISKDVIAHVSLYAQEQSILEVAKTIRGHLTQLLLPIADNNHVTFGEGKSMNLLQWLLWQLYGNGHRICPYFVVSPFALKYIRTSGFGAGVLIHLLNLQDYQLVAAVPPLGEYIVGLPNGSDLTYLIQRIAPSALSPETVQGVALPDNGQRTPFTSSCRIVRQDAINRVPTIQAIPMKGTGELPIGLSSDLPCAL